MLKMLLLLMFCSCCHSSPPIDLATDTDINLDPGKVIKACTVRVGSPPRQVAGFCVLYYRCGANMTVDEPTGTDRRRRTVDDKLIYCSHYLENCCPKEDIKYDGYEDYTGRRNNSEANLQSWMLLFLFYLIPFILNSYEHLP